jgi:hypothetical protein
MATNVPSARPAFNRTPPPRPLPDCRLPDSQLYSITSAISSYDLRRASRSCVTVTVITSSTP